MKLENSFVVRATPVAALSLLMYVARLIQCMPCADLLETVDESNWKERMRV